MFKKASSSQAKGGWSIWEKLAGGALVALPLCAVGVWCYGIFYVTKATLAVTTERLAAERVHRFIEANDRPPQSYADLFQNGPEGEYGPSREPRDSDRLLVLLFQNVDIDFSATLEQIARSDPNRFTYVRAKRRRKDVDSWYVPDQEKIIKAAAEALELQRIRAKPDEAKPPATETPR